MLLNIQLVDKTMGIPDDMAVICSMAIMYDAPKAEINTSRPGRLSCEYSTQLTTVIVKLGSGHSTVTA